MQTPDAFEAHCRHFPLPRVYAIPLCGLVDEAGEGSYLETGKDENVRLCERYGFQVVSEVRVLGGDTWQMWREPGGGHD